MGRLLADEARAAHDRFGRTYKTILPASSDLSKLRFAKPALSSPKNIALQRIYDIQLLPSIPQSGSDRGACAVRYALLQVLG